MRALRAVLLSAVSLGSCGPSEPPRTAEPTRTAEGAGAPEPAPTDEPTPRPARGPTAQRVSVSSGIEVEGEVGGLDPEAVDAILAGASSQIDACWQRSTEQNELVSGTIRLALGVGGQGRTAYAFVQHSTLGDAGAERCLLGALSGKTWPKPVGGKIGVVRTNLGFELPKGARGPTPWTSERVSDVLAAVASELGACKQGINARFTATVYVKQIELPPPTTDADAGGDAAVADAADAGPTLAGAAISVGIAAPDAKSATASDCLERVLSRATYPAPGDWPAKVTFEL